MSLASLILGPVVTIAIMAPQSEDASKPELVPVVLRIDVSPLEVAQEKYWVDHTLTIAKQRLPPMLEAQGIALVDEAVGDVATVTVTLSWINYQESIYATDIAVTRPGHPDQKLERITCSPCMDHMVMNQLEPHFEEILPWLAADLPVEPSPTVAPVEESSPPTPSEPNADLPASIEPVGQPASEAGEPRRGLGPLGWAGVATASLGAAALISGGVVFAQGEKETASIPAFREYRDYRPAGTATMATGAVVLSAGVAMIFSHLLLRKRERTTATAAIGRNQGALMLIRRF